MKAYVSDGKVYIVNDVMIIRRTKSGKLIRFEVERDYSKDNVKVYIKNGVVLPSPNKKKKPKAELTIKDRLAMAENDIPEEKLEWAKRQPKVELSEKEADMVFSNLNTHLTDEERKLPVVTRDIENFSYTVINFGRDNYLVVKKKKIEDLPTVKEVREGADGEEDNRN